MGTEDCIVFTTGYQANLGCIGTILEPGDTVICDSGDHASILDGCRLSGAKLRPFRHNQMEKLERMLERAGDDGGGVLVVVDGVFSMEGDVGTPAGDRRSAVRAHGARLMVDEAHAVGVLGERGAGTCELFGLEDRVDLRMGTFSKSLASCGGFIAGPADVIEYLRIATRAVHLHRVRRAGGRRRRARALRVIRSEGPELMERLLDNAALPAPGPPRPGAAVVEPGRCRTAARRHAGRPGRRSARTGRPSCCGRPSSTPASTRTSPSIPPSRRAARSFGRPDGDPRADHLDRALEIFAGVDRRVPGPAASGIAARPGTRSNYPSRVGVSTCPISNKRCWRHKKHALSERLGAKVAARVDARRPRSDRLPPTPDAPWGRGRSERGEGIVRSDPSLDGPGAR